MIVLHGLIAYLFMKLQIKKKFIWLKLFYSQEDFTFIESMSKLIKWNIFVGHLHLFNFWLYKAAVDLFHSTRNWHLKNQTYFKWKVSCHFYSIVCSFLICIYFQDAREKVYHEMVQEGCHRIWNRVEMKQRRNLSRMYII